MATHLQWQLKLIFWTCKQRRLKSWQIPSCWEGMGGKSWQRDGKVNCHRESHQKTTNKSIVVQQLHGKILCSPEFLLLIYYLNCVFFLWFSVYYKICIINLQLPLIIRTRMARMQVLHLSPCLPQQLLQFCNYLHSYS